MIILSSAAGATAFSLTTFYSGAFSLFAGFFAAGFVSSFVLLLRDFLPPPGLSRARLDVVAELAQARGRPSPASCRRAAHSESCPHCPACTCCGRRRRERRRRAGCCPGSTSRGAVQRARVLLLLSLRCGLHRTCPHCSFLSASYASIAYTRV